MTYLLSACAIALICCGIWLQYPLATAREMIGLVLVIAGLLLISDLRSKVIDRQRKP